MILNGHRDVALLADELHVPLHWIPMPFRNVYFDEPGGGPAKGNQWHSKGFT